jgi:pilus assembly protein Flp/PilA
MRLNLWILYSGMQRLIMREEGQDLIEYALVVALIAFAATVGMSSLATSINTAFTAIGTVLTSYTG